MGEAEYPRRLGPGKRDNPPDKIIQLKRCRARREVAIVDGHAGFAFRRIELLCSFRFVAPSLAPRVKRGLLLTAAANRESVAA
jgi:hypothetical protein